MSNISKMQAGSKLAEYIKIDHQDYVEDRLISLCDELENTGIETIKIASGLIFALHDLLCKSDWKDAEQYYSVLLKECQDYIAAMQEFYRNNEQN